MCGTVLVSLGTSDGDKRSMPLLNTSLGLSVEKTRKIVCTKLGINICNCEPGLGEPLKLERRLAVLGGKLLGRKAARIDPLPVTTVLLFSLVSCLSPLFPLCFHLSLLHCLRFNSTFLCLTTIVFSLPPPTFSSGSDLGVVNLATAARTISHGRTRFDTRIIASSVGLLVSLKALLVFRSPLARSFTTCSHRQRWDRRLIYYEEPVPPRRSFRRDGVEK